MITILECFCLIQVLLYFNNQELNNDRINNSYKYNKIMYLQFQINYSLLTIYMKLFLFLFFFVVFNIIFIIS